MKGRPGWDPDAQYIEKRIRWTINGLLGKFGFTPSDTQDLQQDFLLDLMVRLKSFKPERAHRKTFISRIISNRARTLIEMRKAQKRNFAKTGFSINEEVDGPEGGMGTRLEQAEIEDYKHRIFGRFISEFPALDLTIDVTAILSGIPREHRLICERLSQGDRVAEISRDLNMSRTTVYERLSEVRRRLVRAGFS